MGNSEAKNRIDRSLAGAGIPGLGPAAAAKLARKGVRTVRDLLEYVPRSWLDVSNTKPIRDLKIGEQATILGTVKRVDGRYLRGRKHMLHANPFPVAVNGQRSQAAGVTRSHRMG